MNSWGGGGKRSFGPRFWPPRPCRHVYGCCPCVGMAFNLPASCEIIPWGRGQSWEQRASGSQGELRPRGDVPLSMVAGRGKKRVVMTTLIRAWGDSVGVRTANRNPEIHPSPLAGSDTAGRRALWQYNATNEVDSLSYPTKGQTIWMNGHEHRSGEKLSPEPADLEASIWTWKFRGSFKLQ